MNQTKRWKKKCFLRFERFSIKVSEKENSQIQLLVCGCYCGVDVNNLVFCENNTDIFLQFLKCFENYSLSKSCDKVFLTWNRNIILRHLLKNHTTARHCDKSCLIFAYNVKASSYLKRHELIVASC